MWVVILLVILFVLMFRKPENYTSGLYRYGGSLDEEYDESHPSFGRIANAFQFKSPSDWPFQTGNGAVLNVRGI